MCICMCICDIGLFIPWGSLQRLPAPQSEFITEVADIMKSLFVVSAAVAIISLCSVGVEGKFITGFLMTMVMTTIQKSSFEGEVDQWLTMVDRIIVYIITVPSKYST